MVIPDGIANPLTDMLVAAGLKIVHQGKVRDTFLIPGHPDKLLILASDRISIYDFLLSALVPKKGEVLTAMSAYWFYRLKTKNIQHHLIAAGANISKYLPPEIQGNPILQGRAMVVRRLKMLPVEFVVRGYLTGSGWKEYQQSGAVGGVVLPVGLHDGSQLDRPLFTPTSKAMIGHDQPMDPAEVEAKYGVQVINTALNIYSHLATAAAEAVIILADTKFEFGYDEAGQIVLADEVGTTDSSRFWSEDEWRQATAFKRAPIGYDKQVVREWGKTVSTPDHNKPGIHLLDPGHAGHVAWVDDLEVPVNVVQSVTERYLEFFYHLTGYNLNGYQRAILGII